MDPRIVLPALTSILALVFALALLDQWRERRGAFQLVWTFGMLFYGIGSACEAMGAPQSWPNSTTGSSSSSAATAATSPASSRSV